VPDPGALRPGPLDPAQLRFDPPSVSIDVVREMLHEHWGLSGRLRPLDGERDQNTRVTTDDGRDFVLKIASPSEDSAVADLQCAALVHVARADGGIAAPQVVPTLGGVDIVSTDVGGAPAPTRLLTFVRGVTFDDARDLSLDDLRAVGAAQGRLAAAFTGFEHRAAGNFMAWSLDAGMVHDDELWDGLDNAGRAAAGPVRERVLKVARRLEEHPPGVRRQVLHNDGHRGNLLRTDAASNVVSGVIDFGDVAHTCVVADLAICLSSFVVEHPDQGAAAAALASGYDRWMPLTDIEIELLFDLVVLRTVLGLLLVSFQTRHAPAHRLEEISGELEPYRAHLGALGDLDPKRVTDQIRQRILAQRRTDGPEQR